MGGQGCSEPRSQHCTPAWATEQDPVSKKNKKKKERKKEKERKKRKRKKKENEYEFIIVAYSTFPNPER